MRCCGQRVTLHALQRWSMMTRTPGWAPARAAENELEPNKAKPSILLLTVCSVLGVAASITIYLAVLRTFVG